MSDKSFEQQVREELSDLRMKPNAAVWESVAASLKKERKRRWVLWMVFLLAGLSGTGFWWLIQEQSGRKELSNKNQVQKNISIPVQETPLIQKDSITLATEIKTIEDSQSDNPQAATKNISSNKIPLTTASIKQVNLNRPSYSNTVVQLNKKPKAAVQTLTQDILKNEKEVLPSATVVNTNTVDLALLKDPVADKKPEKPDTTSFTGIQAEKKDTVTITQETEPVKPVLSDSAVTNKKTVKANKWQWRIGFNAGTSGIRNSIRSLLEQTNTRAYDNAFSGASAPITGSPGTGSNAPGFKPVVRDAFSFGSSIEIIRKLGKKEQHALGLTAGYHLYTTRTGVGNLNTGTIQFNNVNTTNDGNEYYAVKDSASYTSYYHFIQLGIRYYHSLNWFKKIEMQWYGGIGVNALLGSNGLHLGSFNAGAYLFENRSLLRSFQVDVSGGLDFGLGKSKKIYLGPQMQYMLSNLSKQPGVSQHLFRPSIRLSFLLDKRK